MPADHHPSPPPSVTYGELRKYAETPLVRRLIEIRKSAILDRTKILSREALETMIVCGVVAVAGPRRMLIDPATVMPMPARTGGIAMFLHVVGGRQTPLNASQVLYVEREPVNGKYYGTSVVERMLNVKPEMEADGEALFDSLDADVEWIEKNFQTGVTA